MDATIPATQNPEWGFFGTITHHAEPQAAWALALPAIVAATGCSVDEVRAFLDSRHGRHFADEVAVHMTDDASRNSAAIDMAVDRWMRWTISPRTSEDTGIPVNLPYLTGFVLHAAIAADAI